MATSAYEFVNVAKTPTLSAVVTACQLRHRREAWYGGVDVTHALVGVFKLRANRHVCGCLGLRD